MKIKFYRYIAAIITLIFTTSMTGALYAGSTATSVTPSEALDKLKKGNQRFTADKRLYANQGGKTRTLTAEKGQFPFASVLGCADSRAPIEHIFDAGVGEIFTIRVAGNVSDTDEIGTIEYGVGHLGTPVLVVLGHTRCGAVTAVVKGDTVHGSIPALVDNIVPAAEKARKKMGTATIEKLVEEAIRQNVWQSIEDLLKRSDETRHLVREKKLMVVGALYNLQSGEVEWLGEHPDQAGLTGHGSSGHSTVIPLSFMITNGIILGIFILFFIFFIGKNRLIKGVQVKGRIFASFVAVILSLGFTITRETIHAAEPGMGAARYINAGLSLALSLIFAVACMNSIIGSFKRVITALRSASGGPAGNTEKQNIS